MHLKLSKFPLEYDTLADKSQGVGAFSYAFATIPNTS